MRSFAKMLTYTLNRMKDRQTESLAFDKKISCLDADLSILQADESGCPSRSDAPDAGVDGGRPAARVASGLSDLSSVASFFRKMSHHRGGK